jgi:hypothetical protein
MAQLPSSLSLQSLETCGSFWLSVASTMAWPTFLTAVGLIYLKVKLTYGYYEGGKLERETILGVVDHHAIVPGSFTEPPQFGGLSGGFFASSHSSIGGSGFSMVEAGFGSSQLFASGYPILNFCWPKTGNDALNTSVQLVRKMIRRPVLEEENISWTKIAISTVGFVIGLVGLLRDPSSLPAGVTAMFIAGVIPDIRVFLLANTVTSVISFFSGLVTGLISRAPSASRASRIVSPTLTVIWSLLCLALFGVGCWQINTRRTRKESVWPMFIYWAPATSMISVDICGIDPIPLLAMTGVVLGIVGENNISCG